jgi:hypothetical protein
MLTTFMRTSPANVWQREYTLWADSAVNFLREIGRAETAEAFRNVDGRRWSDETLLNLSAMQIGITDAQMKRLRGQKELLEMLQRELRG